MKYMKLLIRILVLFYTMAVKELTAGEKARVQENLNKRFGKEGESSLPKLLQAVNKMAERLYEKNGEQVSDKRDQM